VEKEKRNCFRPAPVDLRTYLDITHSAGEKERKEHHKHI
jgi:hypothetical protein